MPGDIGKGVLAVLLAKWFFSAHLNDAIYYRGAIIGVYLAAFFAVIGHVYPLYFGFKGWQGSLCGNRHHRRAGARAACAAGGDFLRDAGVRQNGFAGKRAVRRGLPAGDVLLQQFFVHAPAAQTGAAAWARLWWACLSSGCTAATSRASARVRNTNFFRKKSDARPAFSFCLVGGRPCFAPLKNVPGAAKGPRFGAARPR